MRQLVKLSDASPAWTLIGWMGVAAGFLILSFYGVIAGWSLYYLSRLAPAFRALRGRQHPRPLWAAADPLLMIGLQTAFMAVTILIVARGVSGGLELAIRWFMPLLLLLLLVLLGYSLTSGGLAQGLDFMFSFHPERLGVEGVLDAMGQAFFTLSLGMGAIMAYGAYVPSNASITSTIFTIALLDTFVAVAAGLVIFPLVFANGLNPAEGPGLMFVTLPLAFGQMPFGAIFGGVFFLLVSFAALTSAISLTEPALAWLVEDHNAKRGRVAVTLGVISGALGLGTVFSFNIWADVQIFGKNFFDRWISSPITPSCPWADADCPLRGLGAAEEHGGGPARF